MARPSLASRSRSMLPGPRKVVAEEDLVVIDEEVVAMVVAVAEVDIMETVMGVVLAVVEAMEAVEEEATMEAVEEAIEMEAGVEATEEAAAVEAMVVEIVEAMVEIVDMESVTITMEVITTAATTSTKQAPSQPSCFCLYVVMNPLYYQFYPLSMLNLTLPFL